jgi:hypothetical protein
MNNSITPEQAASIFLNRIIGHVYDGAIGDMRSFLEEGPPGRKKQQELIELKEWFHHLDETGQKNILALIERAIRHSVFSFLVVLDNKTIGYPIESQNSDFAVYLQTYENDEARFNYAPQTSARINLSYTVNGDLHDQFLNTLQERESRR